MKISRWLFLLPFALAVPACRSHDEGPAPPSPAPAFLVLQNEYPTIDLSGTGTSGAGWCMSGSALLSNQSDASNPDPVGTFLGYTDDEIRGRLQTYLDSHSTLDPATSDWIVLDLEHPVHPRDIGDPMYDANRTQLVDAFRRRVAIARELLPNARLTLYGIIVGNSRGEETAGFLESFAGYEAMAAAGVFDPLDAITPVLYQRFGPTDAAFDTIPEYTRHVLEHSAILRRTDGRALPLAPLLSFRVGNGASAHSGQPADIPSLREQVALCRADPHVVRFGFWSGTDIDPDLDLAAVLAQVLQ